MNIRLANMMDLPAVMEMLQQVVSVMNASGNFDWTSEYPDESMFMSDIKEHNLFVALEDRRVIGAVVIDSFFPLEFGSLEWKSSPNSFTAHRLMVHPEHRRKGIGHALCQYIEYRGQLLGLKSIRVASSLQNEAFTYLLKKMNYDFVGETHLRRFDSDFLCFEKTLP